MRNVSVPMDKLVVSLVGSYLRVEGKAPAILAQAKGGT